MYLPLCVNFQFRLLIRTCLLQLLLQLRPYQLFAWNQHPQPRQRTFLLQVGRAYNHALLHVDLLQAQLYHLLSMVDAVHLREDQAVGMVIAVHNGAFVASRTYTVVLDVRLRMVFVAHRHHCQQLSMNPLYHQVLHRLHAAIGLVPLVAAMEHAVQLGATVACRISIVAATVNQHMVIATHHHLHLKYHPV